MPNKKERVGGGRASIASVGHASRFSIITPTQEPKHLERLYLSLRNQSFEDWSWFILINGEERLPDKIAADARVHKLNRPRMTTTGEMKALLCARADGEYLVEVETEDWLHPNALYLIDKTIKEHENVDFLYSDFVNIGADGTSQVFSQRLGWESYTFELGAVMYKANRAPPCNARSMYQIFYAPNHVRVWRKDFYHQIDGHDRNLPLCDDHDLLCRTYLAGASMVHIPEPLYFHQLHKDQTTSYLVQDAEIQQQQQAIGDRYFYDLVAEETRRRGLMKVDMTTVYGSIGDYEELCLSTEVDINNLLDSGFPYPDESVGILRAVDFLNRVPQKRLVELMNEIWRVLAPNGFLISSTPSTEGKGAFCDPDQASYWNDLSFRYYCSPNYIKHIPNFTGLFQATRVWTNFPSIWHKENNVPYVHADIMKIQRLLQ